MWWVDIRNTSAWDTASILVSDSKYSLYRFNHKNYLRDMPQKSLVDKLTFKMLEFNITIDHTDECYLLGQLSNLGVYFSPLNLYFINKKDGARYILAEVSNTPWNERHYYLLNPQQNKIIHNKKFHVSPFFNMNQEYRWNFNCTDDQIYFTIDTYQDKKRVFQAGYTGKLINTNDKNFYKTVIKYPLNVYKIIFGIYFEAFILWIKKVPYVPYVKHNKL